MSRVPKHPKSNGNVEKYNCTFKDMLAKAFNNAPGDWEDYVGSISYMYVVARSYYTCILLYKVLV